MHAVVYGVGVCAFFQKEDFFPEFQWDIESRRKFASVPGCTERGIDISS